MIYTCLKEIRQPIFPKDLINYLKRSPIFFKGIFQNDEIKKLKYMPVNVMPADYLRLYYKKFKMFLKIKGKKKLYRM